MSRSTADSDRPDRAAVRERLDEVRDPELDRSIVDLQYIDTIDIDGSDVRVRLRLPTAWCSPAFAWLMATDARDAVREAPGVDDVTVRLDDHMHAGEINHGVDENLSFDEAFDDADDDIEAVKRKLDHKARMRRQFRAMTALLDAGLSPEQAAALSLSDVDVDERLGRATVSLSGLVVVLDAEPVTEYVEKARETGVVTGPDDRLFATADGDPIAPDPEEFERVRREARLAKQNMEGQGAICAGLHEARYDDVTRVELD